MACLFYIKTENTEHFFHILLIGKILIIKTFRESMITVKFGGVTVENKYTTTEIISGTLPPMMSHDLQYTVEIRGGHSLSSPSVSNALNIGDPIVRKYLKIIKKNFLVIYSTFKKTCCGFSIGTLLGNRYKI